VDTAAPAHLVEEQRWLQMHNFRPYRGSVTQVPRRVRAGAGATNTAATTLQVLATMATGTRDEALILGLTRTNAYQLRVSPTAGFGYSMTPLAVNGTVSSLSPVFVDSTTRPRRWSTAMYNGQMWFTNDYNPTYYTDGSRVNSYQGVDLPKARYIESFYDHMVVGNYTYKGETRPNGILSSGLYNPSDWTTTHANEVARIDFEEFAQPDFPLVGLTGLKRMNNLLVAYLPTALIGLRYVGLPKVYQWDPITEHCGNSLMYGMTSHANTHFFFDGVQLNFCSFSAEGVQVIGTRIVTYFGETISTDFELQQRTWAYVWRERQEVWWIFCSTASEGEYDKAVVYNWQSKEWFTADVENLHAFGGLARRAETCDELDGTCDELTGEADDLSANGEPIVPRLWADGDNLLLREVIVADTDEKMIEVGVPVLETKDYDYGDSTTVKEVDAILIDAKYAGECRGIDVYVSARKFLNDTVTYTLVGRWVPTVEEGELTFAGIAGNIFRYKFELVGPMVRDARWSLWAETIADDKAAK
jgi:hypothetical protein